MYFIEPNKTRLQVWYMVASDEGHGYAKKANVDQYQAAIVQFFSSFLLSQ